MTNMVIRNNKLVMGWLPNGAPWPVDYIILKKYAGDIGDAQILSYGSMGDIFQNNIKSNAVWGIGAHIDDPKISIKDVPGLKDYIGFDNYVQAYNKDDSSIILFNENVISILDLPQKGALGGQLSLGYFDLGDGKVGTLPFSFHGSHSKQLVAQLQVRYLAKKFSNQTPLDAIANTPKWASENSYPINMYIVHKGKLYKSTSAITPHMLAPDAGEVTNTQSYTDQFGNHHPAGTEFPHWELILG